MPKMKRKNAIESTRAQIAAREGGTALDAGQDDAIVRPPALRKHPTSSQKKARGRK